MTKKDEAKAAARRATREQRRAAQREAAARVQRRRALIWGAVGLAVVAVIVLVVASNARRPSPGAGVRTLGNAHIPQGQPYRSYNSNPPTSGPHWPSPATWGVYTEPLPDEVLVHNLEHGGIWISYKDAKDTDLAGKLAEIARRYRSKVIVTPRAANDAPLAVAAWGRLLKLQAFDEAQIVAFIDAYRGKIGPEPNAP
ncbi:MAG: DUF3105 domain-containing protein [Armatimonadetes bacterium]|nr:DUF3105 domain-containing protein [Armatimonadota bacterium]